jgi:hypothetical protein
MGNATTPQVITPETMPVEAIAMACIFSGAKIKNAKKAIPGRDPAVKMVREVEFTARVKGTLTKLPDEKKPCVFGIPWQTVCAVLFSKVNEETRNKVFREALEAAVEADEEAREALDNQINEQASVVCEGMKAATLTTFSGRTTFKGTAVVLNLGAAGGPSAAHTMAKPVNGG